MSDVDIANMALRRIGAKTITSLTADNSKEDRVCNTFYDQVRQELLEDFDYNFAKAYAKLGLSGNGSYVRYDEYDDEFDYTPVSITAITQADPPSITAVGHGLVTGDHVYLYSIEGMTELNNNSYHITKSDADAFTLTGIDSTNFTAYSSGGYVQKIQPSSKYANGFTYDLPADYLRAISLDNETDTFEIINDSAGNKYLVTTIEDPVLKYIRDVTDTDEFSASFKNLFILRLATIICIPIIGVKNSGQILKTLIAETEMIEGKTKTISAKETNYMPDTSCSWIDAR